MVATFKICWPFFESIYGIRHLHDPQRIFFVTDSPYLAKVNSAISMLQDEGLLDKLLEKHFPNSTLSVCPTVTPNTMAPHVPTATILTTTTTPPPLF